MVAKKWASCNSYNSDPYLLHVSDDGKNFRDVANITGPAGEPKMVSTIIKPTVARHFRLLVEKNWGCLGEFRLEGNTSSWKS